MTAIRPPPLSIMSSRFSNFSPPEQFERTARNKMSDTGRQNFPVLPVKSEVRKKFLPCNIFLPLEGSGFFNQAIKDRFVQIFNRQRALDRNPGIVAFPHGFLRAKGEGLAVFSHKGSEHRIMIHEPRVKGKRHYINGSVTQLKISAPHKGKPGCFHQGLIPDRQERHVPLPPEAKKTVFYKGRLKGVHVLPKEQLPELPGYILRIFRRQGAPWGIGYGKIKNFLGMERQKKRKEKKEKCKVKSEILHDIFIGSGISTLHSSLSPFVP
jgi:hypothetical protein